MEHVLKTGSNLSRIVKILTWRPKRKKENEDLRQPDLKTPASLVGGKTMRTW